MTEEKKTEEMKKPETTEVAKPETSKAKKNAKRVWRQIKPRVMRNLAIVTFHRDRTTIDGTDYPAECLRLYPNPAGQYVLNAGAKHYDDQLAAIQVFEDRGMIKEVDAKTDGVPFISKEEKEYAELEARRRELAAELGINS